MQLWDCYHYRRYNHTSVPAATCFLRLDKGKTVRSLPFALSLTPHSRVYSVPRWRHDISPRINKILVGIGKQTLASLVHFHGTIVRKKQTTTFARSGKRSLHEGETRRIIESDLVTAQLLPPSARRVHTILHALAALLSSFPICNSSKRSTRLLRKRSEATLPSPH